MDPGRFFPICCLHCTNRYQSREAEGRKGRQEALFKMNGNRKDYGNEEQVYFSRLIWEVRERMADAEKSLAYEVDFEYTKGNRQIVGTGGNC